jgi:hypothetical protein
VGAARAVRGAWRGVVPAGFEPATNRVTVTTTSTHTLTTTTKTQPTT